MTPSAITVSIVSHRQADLARVVIGDLRRHCGPDIDIVLTVNAEEDVSQVPDGVRMQHNSAPKGFAANHNAAFGLCRTPLFCVVNPDIRFNSNPLPALAAALSSTPRAAVAAPLVRAPDGTVEDSARRFPTIRSLLRKLAGKTPRLDYAIGRERFYPDWVAGMFMLFRRDAFAAVGGFDERYHLYYEDVDICARLRRTGWDIVCDPSAEVVHEAQRASRRDFRHAFWHASSMARYLRSGVGRVAATE